MKKVIILFVGFLLLSFNAYSRKRHIHEHEQQDSSLVKFTKSLNKLKSTYYSHLALWDNDTIDVSYLNDIDPNPYFYKLFVPPTYYSDVVKQKFQIDWNHNDYQYNYTHINDSAYADNDSICNINKDSIIIINRIDSTKVFKVGDLQIAKRCDSWSNDILMNFYIEHPMMVLANELDFKDIKPLSDELVDISPRKEHMFNLLRPENPVETVSSHGDLIVVKPNFWTHKGNGYAQFTQLYISDNWYKGGESTNALLSGLVLEANYDDKQKVQFENKLEMKLGFITAPSDTVHRYKTNADLFRITSKLGIRAHNNWYYTLAAELKSQFFSNYQTNTNNLISSFLTPAQLDVTLGMDFKKSKSNYTLSLLTSPLAYNLVYLKDKNRILNPSTFNVLPGRSSANLFGSKFSGNLNWKIIPNIIWDSKLDYFTTYHAVIANWENTFTLVLNRYLSTKIFFHGRYDDGVTLKGNNKSYFQLQELLSFGLNYYW